MKIKQHSLLFKAIVGSHAYGTNKEGSDIDYKGVYIQSPESVLEDGYVPHIQVGKDEAYYEVGRFLNLCETANPSVLELLYTPEDCIEYMHPSFGMIRDNRDMFLTKRCALSFGGYAIQQIEKAKGLNKKMNMEESKMVRKTILDFCYVHEGCGSTSLTDYLEKLGLEQRTIGLVALPNMRYCYAMYFDKDNKYQDFKPAGIAHDEMSNDVSTTSISLDMSGGVVPSLMFFNKDAYSSHCREYKEYQIWLNERNVQRYVDVKSHGQQIDGKNMLHCVRLLETAVEIPKEKVINVRRPNREYLLAIRKGDFNLDEIMSECKEKLKGIDKIYAESDLPDEVEETKVKQLTIKVRKHYKENCDKQ